MLRQHGLCFNSLKLAFILFFVVYIVPTRANKWEATSFCKCICFQSNYTILRLDIPDNPSKPCLSCTKQWCLNQNLKICVGASIGDTDPDTATGKEGDVEARCFQRDSPRDQLVVTVFLLTIFGLLLGAGIKNRMLKAGLHTSLPWNASMRWWEVSGHCFIHPVQESNVRMQECMPRRHQEGFHLHERNGNRFTVDENRGDYRELAESLPR
ncbi:hypothetical protein BJ138DRAFT_951239 [Hygrophoropsis aurantiaca]|uniref:Uncharacterized protein n=1 Tax=Hygrophoropsis aurantiaca TaxID=72124 RepID=A0ACB8ADS4_9AGAM|nr:hypothetical protein BJ138DRAFT_951239 [Hygrophoropsis aurantiaca]